VRVIVRTASLAIVALVVAAAPAGAQSMVPPRGAGEVSFIYQTGLIKNHILTEATVDVGHITTHAVMVDFSVGLGKHFAVGVSVPLVMARYDGGFGHRPNAQEAPLHPTFTFIDDGRYHTAWQDFRLELRYALEKNGVHAMPFVTVILPSHSYEYLAHSAVGRRVREVRIGAAIHRLLTPWSARSFVQSHIGYGFQEEIAGISRGITHINLEGGYFVKPNLSVFGLSNFHITNGGIDVRLSPRAELSGELFINHDRIVRERMINLGAGAAYALPAKFTLVGTVTRTVWGINTHSQAYLVTIGLSRSFGGGGAHGH
jgi:hypothetical protein